MSEGMQAAAKPIAGSQATEGKPRRFRRLAATMSRPASWIVAPWRERAGFRFRSVLITSLMAILILATAVPLALSERTVGAMTRKEVRQQFELMSRRVRSRFAGQFDSADVVLDTLSACFAVGTADEATGIKLARTLSDLRETSSIVLAVYVAKGDGSFSLARAVTPATRGKAEAAGVPQAVYEVQIGASRDGRLNDSFTYLDDLFDVIARTEPVPADYDSRERSWYKLAQASDRAVVTSPYRFQDYPLSGLTMSRRGRTGGGDVFAIDVTLDDLSAWLRERRSFDGEQVSVLQDDGWLVADSAVASLPIRLGEPGDPRRNRRAPEIDRVDAVYRAFRRDHRPRDVAVAIATDRILASFSTFRFDNRDFVIASTLPSSVFEAPMLRWTRLAFAVECAVAAVALFLALKLAGAVSGPITALAMEVEGIINFRGERVPRRPSRLHEIKRLAGAIDMLELTLKAFATYTPQRLVKGIVDSGALPNLGGTRSDVVVMFSDIEGFTSLAEDTAPAALTEQLSRHLSAIAEEVAAAGGTVDKFIGDSVMAFWDGDGAAVAACGAALAAVARVEALNAAFTAEGLRPMRSRFGLHKGEAMLGNVGAPGRMSYTVLGHAVNVASRIEALNKEHGTTVLVSAAVAGAAGAAFGFIHVADAVVRGARTSVGLYVPVSRCEVEPRDIDLSGCTDGDAAGCNTAERPDFRPQRFGPADVAS